jgi:hypothetical protein
VDDPDAFVGKTDLQARQQAALTGGEELVCKDEGAQGRILMGRGWV